MISLTGIIDTATKCATCTDMDTAYAHFKSAFPGIIPDYNENDSMHQKRNRLFENYMNYTLGLSKSTADYLDFMAACENYTSPLFTRCDTLNSRINGFRFYDYTVVHPDSSGCDTTFIKLNTGGWLHDPRFRLADWMQSGLYHMPPKDTILQPATYLSTQLNYVDTLCLNDHFVFESKVRFQIDSAHRQHYINNNPADLNYGKIYGTVGYEWHFNNLDVILFLVKGTFAHPSGTDSMYAVVNYTNAGETQVNSLLIPTGLKNLNNWNNVKIDAHGKTCNIYLNGSLLYSFNYADRFSKFYQTAIDPYGYDLQVDWLKMFDSTGTVKYFEDFNGCDSLKRNQLPRCKTTCQQQFADYYNSFGNTHYTFSQIDTIYFTACGSHLNVCDTSCSTVLSADTLKAVYNQFKSIYPNLQKVFTGDNVGQGSFTTDKWNDWNWDGIGKAHNDASGCDTTFWRINNGGWYHNPAFAMADYIHNGVMRVSPADTMTYGGQIAYNFVHKMCVNGGYRIAMRVKSPRKPWDLWNLRNTMIFETYNNSFGYYIVVPQVTDPISGYMKVDSNNYSSGYSNDPTLNSDFTNWREVQLVAKNGMFKFIIDDTLKFQEAYTVPIYSMGFGDVGSWGHQLELDYWKIYDNDDNLIYEENFDSCGSNPKVYRNCKPDCNTLFTKYFNQRFNTSYSLNDLRCLYNSKARIQVNPCGGAPTLCGSTAVFAPVKVPGFTPCADSTLFSVGVGTKLYQAYRDSLINSFNDQYLQKCLAAKYREKFTVTAPVSEYHYTLYYYDQAGNLVKTVPPAGVDESKFADNNWAATVKSARDGNTLETPSHTLATNYRYNTLNQVVKQSSPDGGASQFWYDRLGRLVISQNAKQKAHGTTELNRLYSYTKYDYLGRISEVGQVKNNDAADPVTDPLTRDITSLETWLSDRNSLRGQITQTVYDLPYAGFAGSENNTIWQRNLRNRVSYTIITDTASLSGYNSASFYTYDIHGNVDTLLQDYGSSSVIANVMNVQTANANRWKRMVYRYDLISGKVNHVAYQPPRGGTYYPDMFYHRYSYDAENRLTLAETSMDSVIWEKESRYQYYDHGPLARSTIGEQLVQGVDYAYTLQGWLKGVNSTSNHEGTYDIGNDGKTSGSNQYVARDAYGFHLNYFAGDYLPINTGVNPFPGTSAYMGSSYKPLYNGNISSMAVNIKFPSPTAVQVPQLYAYSYDQLNRITGMDVFRGLDQSGNSWSAAAVTTDYKERVAYDPNGNILKYLRNGISSVNTNMDSLHYKYYAGTNQLKQVQDAVADGNYKKEDGTEDIDNQGADNYAYDAIGNLIKDVKDSITLVKWNVYGKIAEIQRTPSDARPVNNILYTYDASGNRISKRVQRYDKDDVTYTWYVRDASGNVMATYSSTGSGTMTNSHFSLTLGEQDMYGSSRVGLINRNLSVTSAFTKPTINNFTRGEKVFELSNHLGNVLVTITDKKVGHDGGGGNIDYYLSDIATANDYYPFGMLMPGRKFAAGSQSYRYSINGQERSDELNNNLTTAEFWEYDSRIGRRWNVDPVRKDNMSPYACFSDNPIIKADLNGDSDSTVTSPNGGTFTLPGSATINKLSFAYTNSEGTQYQHKEGAVESFTWRDQEYKANYNTKTGEFTGYKAQLGEAHNFQKLDFSYGKMDRLLEWMKENASSEPTNAFEEYRARQAYTGYLPDEDKWDRIFRMAAYGSLEARREFASGGMNMYGGYGAISKAVTTTTAADGSFYSVAFETQISKTLYPGGSYWSHFKAANTVLNDAMISDANFSKSMQGLGITIPTSSRGIQGLSPSNWVWHHSTAPGILQLVPKTQHPNIPGGIFWNTMHPTGSGGMAIWNK